jgi:tetratricopeptide (TPR) repeat protein
LTEHPREERLASFLEGRLAPAELAEVTSHLRACADCRTVVSESARFSRAEEAAAAVARPRNVRWWWAAAAAIVALVAASLLLRREVDPREQLIAAAPRSHRVVEARLSGFPWARLQPPVRGTSVDVDPADLKLRGAAGDVLASSEASHHARGTALLVIGRPSEAVPELEAAVIASPSDASAWNDLAAARLALSAAVGDSALLPPALAAAERALALAPRSPAALFNRALILEQLGDRSRSRTAWEAYLARDRESGWATEARSRLASGRNQALSAPSVAP